MADESIKTIRERVKELIKESGVQKKMGKDAEKILNTLRARLKAEKDLSKEQKANLDNGFKMSKNEELRLKLAVSESKETRNIGKLLDKQMTTNMKIAKGEMSIVDVVRMKLQQQKALKKSDDLAKKAAELRKKGLDEEALRLENMSETLRDNVDVQKEKFKYDQKSDALADEMITSQKEGLKAFTDMRDKAKDFTKMLAANPMKLVQLAALATVAAMVKMVLMMRELQKELGFSLQQTAQLQGTLMEAGWALKFMGISGEEIATTAKAIMDEFGSMGNVSKETLVTMGELHATLGIAGADAAVLLGMMEGVSGESRETLLNQMKIVGELAQAAGVAPAAVMADVAANTDLWADYAQDGGENIMEAAIQAKALGLNLGVVSKMADSLLDFETSIQDSMEASMMLGRNINTDRARQLALEGDLAGMQKEILSQVGSEAEFNQMNVLQRQALAKAFGLSTAELSKMVREQEKLNERWGIVSWFLAQIGKLTGMFRKLRPILETMGVILGIVLLPLVIKLGIISIKNTWKSIAAKKAELGIDYKTIANDMKKFAMRLASLPMKAKDLALTIAGNVAKGTRNVLEAIGNTTAVTYLGTLIATTVMKAKDIALTIARNVAMGGFLIIMGAITIATWLMTAAQWALNIALSANPIGLIIIGIIALIAGIVLLAKKLGGFGKLASIAFKIAFAPLFLAWEAAKWLGDKLKGLFGGGGKAPAAASPAVSMAEGGIVTKPTTATIGDAGPEAAVPLGNKFDLTVVEEKLDQLIAQDAKLMNTLTKKVGDMGVNG
jgi:hypothetical protein|tara:strand:+ start:261 stop:2615 length:2355 start_codon:yes stop_codon:yes gene_type:complete